MKQMIMLDEKRETVAISGYPAYRWVDRRFRWDKSKYEGVDSIRVPFSYIWHPGIVLYSNTDGEYDPTVHTVRRGKLIKRTLENVVPT